MLKKCIVGLAITIFSATSLFGASLHLGFFPDSTIWLTQDTMIIKWTADSSVDSCSIFISPDNGNTYLKVSDSIISNKSTKWGNYKLALPDSIKGTSIISDSCRIKIISSDTSIFDNSSSFRIVSSKNLISLSKPAAGEVIIPGDTVYINWSADTSIVKKVFISFSNDGGWTYFDLDSVFATSDQWGNYKWVMPEGIGSRLTKSNNAYIKILDPVRKRAALSKRFTVNVAPLPEDGKRGCGAGTGLALLPPFFCKYSRRIRQMFTKKKKS